MKHFVINGQIVSQVSVTIEAKTKEEAIDIASGLNAEDWLELGNILKDHVEAGSVVPYDGRCFCEECVPFGGTNQQGSDLIQ